MRGAQTVGKAPGISTDSNYSSDEELRADYSDIDSWKQWKDLTSGTNGTTICSSSGLTAKSQIDLVNYIITAYSEGTRNPMSENMFEENAIKGKDKIPNFDTLEKINYNFPESTDKTDAITGVSQNAVIKASHYNAFLNQLAADNGNVVTSQNLPNSDKVSGFTPANSGPQVGIQKNDNSKLSEVSNDHTKSSSLITAQIYIDLANQASKLLYHPFQCNVCNVCEGGKFGEIVKELGSAIKEENWIYSQTKMKAIEKTIAGYEGPFSLRQDCSGFVSACVAIYAMAVGDVKTYDSCNQTSLNFTKGDFKYNHLFQPIKAGEQEYAHVIFADHDKHSHHVEASDETGKVWSGGGTGPCIGAQSVCKEHAIMMTTKGSSKRTPRYVAIGSDGLGFQCDNKEISDCYEDPGNMNENDPCSEACRQIWNEDYDCLQSIEDDNNNNNDNEDNNFCGRCEYYEDGWYCQPGTCQTGLTCGESCNHQKQLAFSCGESSDYLDNELCQEISCTNKLLGIIQTCS